MSRHQTPKPNKRTTLETRLETLLAWWLRRANRWKQRRDLSRLDERLLRDIGLTPYDAAREAAKPFWR